MEEFGTNDFIFNFDINILPIWNQNYVLNKNSECFSNCCSCPSWTKTESLPSAIVEPKPNDAKLCDTKKTLTILELQKRF